MRNIYLIPASNEPSGCGFPAGKCAGRISDFASVRELQWFCGDTVIISFFAHVGESAVKSGLDNGEPDACNSDCILSFFFIHHLRYQGSTRQIRFVLSGYLIKAGRDVVDAAIWAYSDAGLHKGVNIIVVQVFNFMKSLAKV